MTGTKQWIAIYRDPSVEAIAIRAKNLKKAKKVAKLARPEEEVKRVFGEKMGADKILESIHDKHLSTLTNPKRFKSFLASSKPKKNKSTIKNHDSTDNKEFITSDTTADDVLNGGIR